MSEETNQNAKTNEENSNENKEIEIENNDEEVSKLSMDSNGRLAKPRHSELFVLHTQKGHIEVNRRCHLPRSVGVNVAARRKLLVASVLCLIFVLCQVIGGVISNSLAVAADAAHTLTDFAGFMISLFAIWLAGRGSTDRLTFGWYRAEVIGALISVMTIWFVTAILVWLAIQRCITSDFEIDAIVMMITATFGIVTNVILAIYLSCNAAPVEINCESKENAAQAANANHYHGHYHHHLHSHSNKFLEKLRLKIAHCFQAKKKRRSPEESDDFLRTASQASDNINVKAAFLHVLGDGLQSVGVLIAAIAIYFQPKWVIADPICTFLFSVIVLYTTINILKDIIVVLMEGTPTHLDYNDVEATFKGIPGVKSIHHLRIWALSLDKVALAVHLVIEHDHDAHDVLIRAEEAIHTRYHLFETTIQIEEEATEKTLEVNIDV